MEAAGLPPAAASAQLNNSDAARSSDAARAEQTNGLPAAGNSAFAGLPALIAGFMTQQGFDAPTEIQSRCVLDCQRMPASPDEQDKLPTKCRFAYRTPVACALALSAVKHASPSQRNRKWMTLSSLCPTTADVSKQLLCSSGAAGWPVAQRCSALMTSLPVAGAGRLAWRGGTCRRSRSPAAAKPWGTCCRAPSGCARPGTVRRRVRMARRCWS